MEAARIPQPRPEAGAFLADLFDSHGRMVLGICRAILVDPQDAEDAAQQAFLSAHAALVNGTRPRRPAAWLAAIARNECRSRIASRLARPQALPLLDDAMESLDAEPLEQVARNAEVDALAAGLSTLPERQREAVLLRDFFGLSYREVAAAMSVTEPAVESLLSRARRRLEECVGPLRAVPGVLVVPQSLRDELARLVPGFPAGEAAAVGTGVGLTGVVAKVVATPLAGKVAAGMAVATLVVGGGDTTQRTVGTADQPRRAAPERSTPQPAAPVEVRLVAEQPRLESRAGEVEEDNSGPSSRSGSGSDSENSGPGSVDSEPDEPQPDNSGPGSLSSGSGSGGESVTDNSGPGSSSSGSDSSGSGSDSSGSGSSGSGDDH